jgi:hypothetical protein
MRAEAFRWLSLLLTVLMGGFALLLLGLSFAFGSGGFGGSTPHPNENTVQLLLGAAVFAPAALLTVTGRRSLVVPGIQAVVVANAMLLM